jgi:multisubunit Na+/H+ antiporter MnhC subunit
MFVEKEGDVFMPNRNRKRTNRIRNLIVVMSLTAIVISVSTYAWFIGMRTVNVSSFDV